MSDFIQRERESGVQYLAGLAATVRACWQRACEHDGIDPAASFVVFSASNPFVQFHRRAMEMYREDLAAYAALGYVGIQIGDRRAELYRPKRAKTGRKKGG